MFCQLAEPRTLADAHFGFVAGGGVLHRRVPTLAGRVALVLGASHTGSAGSGGCSPGALPFVQVHAWLDARTCSAVSRARVYQAHEYRLWAQVPVV